MTLRVHNAAGEQQAILPLKHVLDDELPVGRVLLISGILPLLGYVAHLARIATVELQDDFRHC